MSNLDAMTSKIIRDAQLEAEKILEQAQEEHRSKIEARTKEANVLRTEMLNRAKANAAQLKERMVSSQDLRSRDEVLNSKHELMERVFNMAQEKLKNMEPKKYTAFLEQKIKQLELPQDAILIVPEKYRDEVKKMKGLSLPVSETESVSSGFQIQSEQFNLNFVFDDLMEYQRENLEKEIANRLFAK